MTLCFWPCSCGDQRVRAAIAAHYTASGGAPPGRKLAWCVLEDGGLLGVLGLGEPAFKLAARRVLGLQDARPLPRTVSCWIWRRLHRDTPIRSSAVLRAWHPVAAEAWARAYGETPEHWESMVQPDAVESSVPGACFRRAGYRPIGMTTGWTARRPKGHGHGPRVWGPAPKKLVLYRGPLARVAPHREEVVAPDADAV